MIITMSDAFRNAIVPALALLPPSMTSMRSVGMMLTTGLQESGFNYRRQMGNGPARGFWQFEQGGVNGVLNHPNSTQYANMLAKSRGITDVSTVNVWTALETDDVLAAGIARLLLWTDPKPLPALTDNDATWSLYQRCWRPGKPRPNDWPGNLSKSVAFISGLQ